MATVALVSMLCAPLATAVALPGWEAPAANPPPYELGVDGRKPFAGRFSATIRCTSCASEEPATLMQVVRADAYRGKRLRLSGYLRSADVRRWAGLWMRVDGAARRSLAFDNMNPRAVRGTTPWTRYEIVLDVLEEAVQVSFGFLLAGDGQVWADSLRLEVVEASTASTDLGFPPEYVPLEVDEDLPARPRNLSFEE